MHVLLIAAYPLTLGLMSLGRGPDAAPVLASTTGRALMAGVFELVVFAVVFGAAWFASRVTTDDLLLRWRRGFWPVVWGLGYSVALRLSIAIFVIVVGVALVALGVLSLEGVEALAAANSPNVEGIVDVGALRDNSAYFWLMVGFISFVVAGFREELWRVAFLAGARGLWPRLFATRRAQIGAVVLAAIVFGCGHLAQGALASVMAGLIGLGLIMILHRSIWPAVLAHGFFDATTFALIPYAIDLMHEAQRAAG